MTRDEFFESVRRLIDAWCERRCLGALSDILGPYLGFAGLTDSWGNLRDALHNVRVFAESELLDEELDTIGNLIVFVDKLMFGNHTST